MDIRINLFDMAKKLVLAQNYHDILGISCEESAKITGCERVCFIVQNKRGELVIKAGYPEEGHGIGQKLYMETGEEYLRNVISKGKGAVVIGNPCIDPKMSYMKQMAYDCRIGLIFFVPLFFGKEPLGILAFDKIGHISKEERGQIVFKIKEIADLVSGALWKDYERRKNYERIKREERLISLGKQSAKIAHTIRNRLVVLGGFSSRIIKANSDGVENSSGPLGSVLINEYGKIISDEIERLERIIKDVLRFSALSSMNIVVDDCNINIFISQVLNKLRKVYCNGDNYIRRINNEFDSILWRKNMKIDKDIMEICIDDLIKNAVEAKARKIWVKTKLNFLRQIVAINISNDGEKIEQTMLNDINDIFEPFVTTKADGTGLGLANVMATIEAHGGHISIRTEPLTEFRIEIPLKAQK